MACVLVRRKLWQNCWNRTNYFVFSINLLASQSSDGHRGVIFFDPAGNKRDFGFVHTSAAYVAIETGFKKDERPMIITRIALGISAAAVSLSLALAPAAFAQDSMKKDSMSKDSMSKDSMKKDDGMKKDSMAKDGMKKDDGMMKKDDGMKK